MRVHQIIFWTVFVPSVWGQAPPESPTRFRVKQVAQGVVYIDAGTSAGLAEGMKVVLKRLAPGDAKMAERLVGTAEIVSVATQSALCEIRSSVLSPEPGDQAELVTGDAEVIQRLRLARNRSRYAQVIRFTSGDPLEEEVREYVPRPPLSEEGRLRGRVGFEMNTIVDRGDSGSSSQQQGAIVRADWTRIEGTYWNLTGYWRGRMTSRHGARTETLTDLLSRTYHLGMFYNNPRSRNQFGFGRMLLPWASSLSTLDGGYAARRLREGVTAGVFAGTTPDPTQWNYDPNRQMAGAFTSFEKGSYENVRWTGTVGAAFTRVHGRPERQFLFLENALYAGPVFSVLHNLETDRRSPVLMNGATGAQLSRSFLTVRLQPHQRVAFDVNHNYFRGVPSFDQRLIGTGLVDKLLFEGFSGGVRLEPWSHLMLSTNVGRNTREGEARAALNYMYSIGWKHLPWLDGRVEYRRNRFNSSFGSGSYETIGWMRELGANLRLDLQVGQQQYVSPLSAQTHARFVNSQLDWMFGRHYFITAGWLSYRGQIQLYDQMFITLGYRME